MNRIRLLILPLALALGSIHSGAQSAAGSDTTSIINEIQSSGNITINMPPTLIGLLISGEVSKPDTDTDIQTETESTIKKNTHVGYRIQVFDDNNVRTAKHEAESRKRQLENRFPEFRTYIQFNSPYWRVKTGDFRTRSEADAALSAIRAAFPAFGNQLRIVRDHINSH
ncbi:MAG: SPOR domain-containing protein [Muribaculaceae bacterium]|nr:SPOR domain-containing protein [Muribaculaceae bacterium]